MVFEKIPSFRIDDFPWVIKASKTGSLETRIIYFKDFSCKRRRFKGMPLIISNETDKNRTRKYKEYSDVPKYKSENEFFNGIKMRFKIAIMIIRVENAVKTMVF